MNEYLATPSDRKRLQNAPITLYYRGVLSSCNYDCSYCPFAKHKSPPAELEQDARDLELFVDWVTRRSVEGPLRILFTPWGEALIRPWYTRALVQLSRCEHIERVAIQTNLTGVLGQLDRADRRRLAFWVSYHPDETTLKAFLGRLAELDAMGFEYSVGCVGIAAHWHSIESLRARLPDSIYLWVNADKSMGRPDDDAIARWEQIDPLFRLNVEDYPSRGRRCGSGERSFLVAGDGSVRRCHFVDECVGNIYDDGFRLRGHAPRVCPLATCDCHIGYSHLDDLQFEEIYGQGFVARIPVATQLAAAPQNVSERLSMF